MTGRRVLAIGLDGYEASLADRLMAEGKLENLRQVKDRAARFALDDGGARLTGLAWEQFSTGQTPRDAGRWSAISFDAGCYDVLQMPTERVPFTRALAARTVVFDVPYFDLGRSAGVQGLVRWGAHDPGVATTSRPQSIRAEIEERFGRYAAAEHVYGFTWPSPTRTRAVGAALTAAVQQRARVARWLLAERLPDWELGIVVISELHSVTEPMWHGIDERHPLHGLDSAPDSAAAIEAVYQAVDELVGMLTHAFPDTAILVFALHGMGINKSDVQSMVLLPELLARMHGYSALTVRHDWLNPRCCLLGEDENWEWCLEAQVRPPAPGTVSPGPEPPCAEPAIGIDRRRRGVSIDWIPASRYKRLWPSMRAFALPSFYHGRVRINFEGREGAGTVTRDDYAALCARIIDVIGECRDPASGRPAAAAIERWHNGAPQALSESEADFEVIWSGPANTIDHPTYGRIGPVPFRRTGGHTGAHGVAYLLGTGLPAGDHGGRASADMVPTLFDLLGAAVPPGISGSSLLRGPEVGRQRGPLPDRWPTPLQRRGFGTAF